jgi:putative PIN family toxin of toxin-antitoxin system
VKVVLDTNVFVSGVFFAGPPYSILNAWRHGKLTVVISREIFEEYRRTGEELARRYKGVNLASWLEIVATHALIVDAPKLAQQVCSDPDDDKFLACAIASGTNIIVTGDKALLKLSGCCGIQILAPREFVQKHLEEKRAHREH